MEIALNRIPIFLFGAGFGKACESHKKMPVILLPICIITVFLSMYLLHEYIIVDTLQRYFYFSSLAYLFLAAWFLKFLHNSYLNAFLSFFGKRSLELYLAHILLRKLYVCTPLYVEGDAIRYFILLGLSVIIAFVVEKMEKGILSLTQTKKSH